MILKDRKRLRKLMMRHGLTQRELATEVGWKAHSQVSRLLNGQERSVADKRAQAIADAIGEDVADLFAPRPSGVTGQSVHSKRTAA